MKNEPFVKIICFEKKRQIILFCCNFSAAAFCFVSDFIETMTMTSDFCSATEKRKFGRSVGRSWDSTLDIDKNETASDSSLAKLTKMQSIIWTESNYLPLQNRAHFGLKAAVLLLESGSLWSVVKTDHPYACNYFILWNYLNKISLNNFMWVSIR